MNYKDFSEEQVQQLQQWVSEIQSVSELQTKINASFNTHLTYLEVRFLLDDLQLELKKKETQVDAEGDQADSKPAVPSDDGVQVQVDPVTRPGMIFNGNVRFSDGQGASWGLDQFGRISLKPEQEGYKPSQADIARFQELLQQQLSELSQKKAFGL